MRMITHLRILPVAAGLCVLLGACGGSSDDDAKTKGQSSQTQAQSGTPDDGSAPLGVEAVVLDRDEAPYRDALKAAGYKIVQYGVFPGQGPTKKGRILVYQNGDDGGVMYLLRSGTRETVAWHWYFGSMAPAEVDRVESNGDGLWDLVITGKKGKVVNLIQGEGFTLRGSARDDRIALNGESSAASPEYPLWHCFDGDTNTVWRSPVGRRGAFVEVPSPLGLEEGVLTVTTRFANQPKDCELYAGRKKVQSFSLEKRGGEQTVKLDDAARDASTLRLVIKSTHGGDEVEISELGIK